MRRPEERAAANESMMGNMAGANFERWRFRRVTRQDFPLLGSWLRQPQVHRWWQQDSEPAALEKFFGPSVDGLEPNEDWLGLEEGRPVALIQRSRVAAYTENIQEFSLLGEVPDDAITIDYLLGERRGQGLGPSMLAAFVDRCWTDDPATPAIMVTVVAANRPSWRALQHIGFRIVGQGNVPPENPDDDPLHYLLRLDRPT